MGKTTGFKEFDREVEPYRDAAERLVDFKEIYTEHDESHLRTQGARCMDCGVPFCQSANTTNEAPPVSYGCPIFNLIPEWNDLVYQGHWRQALDRLHKTNNFPEFTGRVFKSRAFVEDAFVMIMDGDREDFLGVFLPDDMVVQELADFLWFGDLG